MGKKKSKPRKNKSTAVVNRKQTTNKAMLEGKSYERTKRPSREPGDFPVENETLSDEPEYEFDDKDNWFEGAKHEKKSNEENLPYWKVPKKRIRLNEDDLKTLNSVNQYFKNVIDTHELIIE